MYMKRKTFVVLAEAESKELSAGNQKFQIQECDKKSNEDDYDVVN